MRYFIFSFFAMLLLAGVGCAPREDKPPLVDGTSTLSSQDIAGQTTMTFFVSSGWSGGFGETLLQTPEGPQVAIDGIPVYLSSASEEAILARASLPPCVVGIPSIKVTATLSLDKKMETRVIGPEETEDTVYYEATISNLMSVETAADACE